ncbi:hypothetical protein AtNW77_Chr5g0150221 [Arabidopsis thaliana]
MNERAHVTRHHFLYSCAFVLNFCRFFFWTHRFFLIITRFLFETNKFLKKK